MAAQFLTLGNFYGIDSLFEFLVIIVASIISLYSYKVYSMLKNKNFKYFSFAFLFIAISFIFKILSNLTILHRVEIANLNSVIVITSQFQYMRLIQFASFIIYKALYLLGALLLFFIATKTKKQNKIMFVYLSVLVIILSIFMNFVFYLTLVFILTFLTSYYYENYKKNRLTNSFLVFLGFLLLSISQLVLIFSSFRPIIDIFGEILMLAGFLVLLINQIKIKKAAKK
ncbi:MAG: hypothetical protein WC402_04715 [Candidatus Pacearchaeota archaeon]|jgi:hypothetical protein